LGGVQEELTLAFEDELELDGHGAFPRMVDALTPETDILPEWKEVRFPPMIRRIVSRVSNRVFVGPTLCRILIMLIKIAVTDIVQAKIPSGGT